VEVVEIKRRVKLRIMVDVLVPVTVEVTVGIVTVLVDVNTVTVVMVVLASELASGPLRSCGVPLHGMGKYLLTVLMDLTVLVTMPNPSEAHQVLARVLSLEAD
jgi:hypothetical protein